MSMTISNQAALSYGTYNLKKSEAYETYAVDSSEISEEYYNVSSVTDALDAMQEANDSASLYSVGRIDSFVKTQYDFSQISIYEKLKDTVGSYDVAGVMSNDTDLSDMYELANSSSQISEDYVNSLLESSSYVQSAASSYSSYLEEDTATSTLLDVTV